MSTTSRTDSVTPARATPAGVPGLDVDPFSNDFFEDPHAIHDILREAGVGRVRGVFHCFTGDEAMARSAFDIDFYVSFAGIVTFPRADAIRAAAKIAPAERILAETDAPYLAPVPHRGKRNEPAFVAEVVGKLADIREVSASDLAVQVTRNFDALFGSLAEATE